jgi:hypothetical protein
MASENKKVNSANVFNFSKGQLTALPTASGNVVVNILIANTTPPRSPRVESIDLLGDVLGAVVAGAEKGTSGTGNSKVTDLSKTLGVLGKVNGYAAWVQHAVQGNGAETVTEGMGVAGGTAGAAGGAWTGGRVGALVGSAFPPSVPFTTAAGIVVGGISQPHLNKRQRCKTYTSG